MTVAEERPVEATEDIYAANGMKLVAKGYAINRSMRDRLLEHQLVKPLEDCMAVSDGVTGARCAQMAEQLLDTHPALRALDLPPSAPNAVKMMADSTYAGRLQTLLTVYNEHRPGKLAHGVCVSLFALNLAQRASLHDTKDLDVMLLAGLAHDVGELYIDPAYLAPGARLGIKEWRHIAAHPVIAHNLLKDLPGLARPASALILEHHERCDGYGYPLGKRGTQLSLPSQILGGRRDPDGHPGERRPPAGPCRHCRQTDPRQVQSGGGGRCQQRPSPAPARAHTRAAGHRIAERGIATLTRHGPSTPADHGHPERVRGGDPAQQRHLQNAVGGGAGALSQHPARLVQHGAGCAARRCLAAPGARQHATGGRFCAAGNKRRLRELERELLARTTQHAPGDLSLLERYLAEVRQQASATDTPESEAPLT